MSTKIEELKASGQAMVEAHAQELQAVGEKFEPGLVCLFIICFFFALKHIIGGSTE